MTPHIALGYLTIADASPAKLVYAAAGAGFDSTGLRITGFHPGETGPGIIGNAANMNELKKAVRETGIGIANISTYRFAPELDVELLKPVFEASAELGATYVLATIFVPEPDMAQEKFVMACELARPFGIELMLEFMPASVVQTLAAAESFLSRAGQSNSCLMIDALHVQRSGLSIEELEKADKTRFRSFQICDGVAERPRGHALWNEMIDRLQPGEGAFPLPQMLQCLPKGIPIEVEVPRLLDRSHDFDSRAKRAYEISDRYLKTHFR